MNWQPIAFVTGFLVLWIGLNRWVLPWLGIPTCMSGSCAAPRPAAEADDHAAPIDAQDHDFVPRNR